MSGQPPITPGRLAGWRRLRTAEPTGAVPRCTRRRDGHLVAGVAGGLAEHLGLDPFHVRIAFALLSAAGGFGVALYGAYWVFLPQRVAGPEPPGLAAAARAGRRRRVGPVLDEVPVGQLPALLAIGFGVLLLAQRVGLGAPSFVLWPAAAVGAGLVVLWRQADQAQARRAAAGESAPGRRVFALTRFVGGTALVAAGLASLVFFSGDVTSAARGLSGGAVVVLGAALIAGPWLLGVWRSLAAERSERIRAQAHADLAAHLHDSVLQTLALIQRQAHDPREVLRLARGQERDLRAFLYADPTGGGVADDASLAAALRAAAAQVEDTLGVSVEVVAVGDRPLDEPGRALVAAAREAMVNAAKHSGAASADVYLEVVDGAVELFVRDRGHGFDVESVPDDRAGIRHSIRGRLERHGGQVQIRSSGAGTEVELRWDPRA